MTNQNGSPEINPNINVLVADDHPANQKLMTAFLKQLDVTPTIANHGQEAVEIFKKRDFDLILMDLEMPHLNGYQATRAIRQVELNLAVKKRTPVVALTAHDLREKRKEILMSGMDDCLSKPINDLNLLKTLQRWVPDKFTFVEHEPDQEQDSTQEETKTKIQSTADLPDKNIFDLELALNRSNHCADLAKDLFEMLLKDIASTKQIKDWYDNQQWSELKDHVHKLHGGCCYNGVPRLRLCCNKLETSLEKKDYAKVDDQVKELLDSIDELKHWAKNAKLDEIFSLEA